MAQYSISVYSIRHTVLRRQELENGVKELQIVLLFDVIVTEDGAGADGHQLATGSGMVIDGQDGPVERKSHGARGEKGDGGFDHVEGRAEGVDEFGFDL